MVTAAQPDDVVISTAAATMRSRVLSAMPEV